jgi:hypothetical protein
MVIKYRNYSTFKSQDKFLQLIPIKKTSLKIFSERKMYLINNNKL